MPMHYREPERADDPHALPDVETFQLTAAEVAETMEDEIHEALKRFPLATMNSREREKALDWIVQEYGVEGGWYYWACFPGCLPDGSMMGPFESEADALAHAREEVGEDE